MCIRDSGYFYFNTGDLAVELDTADGQLNRIDRVVAVSYTHLVICNTSAPQAAHGGESSAKMFPITHDNSAAVQAYRVSIRSSANSRSKCP